MARKQIKITLCSDLCAASGQGISGGADTDVCCDEYGLPYIPARRLKGCLLEAARYIDVTPEVEQKLFGTKGAGFGGGGALFISNALIENYSDTVEAMKSIEWNIMPTQVAEFFTYTRAQTAIKNDVAKDESLRFTKVVKQHSPITQKSLTFYADCECGEYEKELTEICQALRNIGLMRTRGLGAVRSELISDNSIKSNVCQGNTHDNTNQYEISCMLRLKDSLILSGASNDKTLTYIPGTSVLGSLARTYLKTKNPDYKFEELFLKNNIIFSNFYINKSFVAPLFIGKIKSADNQDGRLVSLLDSHEGTVKPLKDSYVDEGFQRVIVQTEMVYHHSRGNEELLYTQSCIKPNQYFSGKIICSGHYVKNILYLLNQQDLRFGRSKTAQYSKCELISACAVKKTSETIQILPSSKVVVALESDVLLRDGYGNDSTSMQALIFEIKKVLHMPDNIKIGEQTSLQYKTVTGYNAIWNLRKPAVRAIAKGSVLIFDVPSQTECPRRLWIGEKNAEGFGEIHVYLKDEIELSETSEAFPWEKACNSATCEALTELAEEAKSVEAIRMSAIAFAKANSAHFSKSKLNAAFVGRVSRMIEQSYDYQDLFKRVKSVKDEGKQKLVLDLINGQAEKTYWREYLLLVFTLGKYYLKSAREVSLVE